MQSNKVNIKKKVTLAHSAEMTALKQCGMKVADIYKKFPQYSRSTVYRHSNGLLGGGQSDRRKSNKGRPKKLSERDERKILRAIPQLREQGNFSSRRIAVYCGIEKQVHNRTIRRVLNRHGYGFYQCRKKGLLTAKDRKLRVDFCRRVKKLKCKDFWKDYISFYLDGTGFQFKTRPLDQAKAPSSRVWRKRSEGLIVTSKGQKEGTKNANFMMGISFDSGVVLCEQYEGSITGKKMAEMIEKYFKDALEKSNAPGALRVLQDGCPRQNSKAARDAFDKMNIRIFKIPPRSPDLNPIENFFHLAKQKLRQQALDENIQQETFQEFSDRLKRTMFQFDKEIINKIIESMDKRVDEIIKSGGYRSKY